MWTALPIAGAAVGCRPPFSFYFDLVGQYWRSEAGRVNRIPFHRVCTLARKQNATFFIIEDASHRPAVKAEIDALSKLTGAGGRAEAISFSFFSTPGWPEGCEPKALADVDMEAIEPDEFLGQAVLINFQPADQTDFNLSYIFEAVFPSPSLHDESGRPRKLLNNFVYTEETMRCEAAGRTFEVSGLYYCQQNGLIHVCAHASLRMALISATDGRVTPDYVNSLLGVVPPCDGLSLGEMVRVIEEQGKFAEVIECQRRARDGYVSVLSRETYISVLASIVESGSKALLIFSTAEPDGGSGATAGPDHVVLVYGHTRHSDEWHPQAIAAYAGPADAPYFPASSWIDHFLIHDDNFGPYYTLSSSALEFKKEVTAHQIIAIRDTRIGTPSQFAEANAASQLANALPGLAGLSSGRWFDYLTAKQRKFVLRTLLIEREAYLSHLAGAVAHDGSRMSPKELQAFANLPDRFWMVEFSLPPLFTGNHSKLGELITSVDDITKTPDHAKVLALRLPGLLLTDDGSGVLTQRPSGLLSHVEIYRLKPHPEVW